MMLKKHILTFLLSLFVLFSGYGRGNAVQTHQSKQKQTEAIGGTVSEHPGPDAEQRIITSEAILHSSIRNQENSSPHFKLLTSKKGGFDLSSIYLKANSNTSLLGYNYRQLARLEAKAYYITFRQILI